MAIPTISERLRRSFHRFIHKWEAIQVELHGHYSVQRFTAMHGYSLSTTFIRATLVLLITLLPSLLLVAFIDAMPLVAPERGLSHSATAWVRFVFTGFVYTHCVMEQIRLYSPKLNLEASAAAYISLATACLTNAMALGLSALICWPLPFATLVLSGPWLGFMTFFLFKVCGSHIRANPEAYKDVKQLAAVCGSQISMVFVYTVLTTIFTTLSPAYQPVFSLLIPGFKVVQKNILCRILKDCDDTKPQVVIFNVEIFNALFISSCMQNAQSIATSITLITVDFLQAAISLYDLNSMINGVKNTMDKIGVNTNQLIEVGALIMKKYPATANRRSLVNNRGPRGWEISSASSFVGIGPKVKQVAPTANTQLDKDELSVLQSKQDKQGLSLPNVGPTEKFDALSPPRSASGTTEDIGTALDSLTSQEHYRLLKRALQVLFLTEFLLLIEFTEVLIPIMYSLYLVILYHWPNRQFYPQLADLTEAELWSMVGSVLTYGMLELVSLVVLICVLYRTTFRHPMQQLAFVLEREFQMVQPKLILWVILTLQSTLPHLGADYTFKFKWLHHHNA